MKKVTIKKLTITNFKGIKSLTIKFNENTSIYGANATGKTSVIDAFLWLLFGKDSQDRASFEIKTLDKHNKPIEKLEHTVEAILDVDDKSVTLKRTLKEKWVTKKGSNDTVFSGNETSYTWNDVPLLASDYSKKVAEIVNEKVFKMITSPLAFNSLKWQDQRAVLTAITGEISDSEIAASNEVFQEIVSECLTKDVTTEDLVKTIKASLKRSKDEIKAIPTRIDEVDRNKPAALNYAELRVACASLEKEKSSIESQMTNKLEAQNELIEKKKELQQDIFNIEKEVSTKKHEISLRAKSEFSKVAARSKEIQNKIDHIDSSIKNAENNSKTIEAKISNYENKVFSLDKNMQELRSSWEKRNAEKFIFDEKECACPTCKRAFDSEQIKEKKEWLEQSFSNDKKKDLELITSQGQGLAKEKETVEVSLNDFKTQLNDNKTLLNDLWSDRSILSKELKELQIDDNLEQTILQDLLKENSSYFNEKESQINSLKETFNSTEKVDVSELKSQKLEITRKINELHSDLSTEQRIKDADKRINELKEEEVSLASTITVLEGKLYNIEQFTKAKMDALEASINKRFSFVKFKLFETQINGGEVPTCKALIDGVPFSDANTASKINAGIDIINTLCDHYSVSAPIFIDNRESVTDIIPCDSQIINLIVSEVDKKLRVESLEIEYA